MACVRICTAMVQDKAKIRHMLSIVSIVVAETTHGASSRQIVGCIGLLIHRSSGTCRSTLQGQDSAITAHVRGTGASTLRF